MHIIKRGNSGIVLDLDYQRLHSRARICLFLGIFGKQGHKWASSLAMGLYKHRRAFLLLVGHASPFLDAAFHLWVLYRLLPGLHNPLRGSWAAHKLQMASAGAPIMPSVEAAAPGERRGS